MVKPDETELICTLCKRDVEILHKHHLIPKSKRGRETIKVCRSCVEMIHVLFTNKELANEYNTLEKLKASPKIKKYVRWIKKYVKKERITIARKKKKR